ncbi:pentatricopeptide repeat-containing protein At2g22410, mitochondrial [Sesamum indicum]|uniref:Pentatricopeptide repeat-containing protein At2g22410, mitochondrial n=1 Tax=Sesamum indicum TaxID=4182 RepID=A0A6I9SZ00_SESIN|nr:pentatricopeptide repeat-containing protein At2g22410, mitochondrial [Sesamum indicum]
MRSLSVVRKQISSFSRLHSSSFQPLRNFSSNSKKWNSTANPNLKITHPTLLLIESCNSMSQAKQIQAQMTRAGLVFHLFPVSRLLSFIALDENGDFSHANALFAQILDRNLYIWNTIIRGCVNKGYFDMGFCYFVRMVGECPEMDKRSYVFGLKACGGLQDFRVGESVYCRIWKAGFVGYVIVRNGLIHLYCESGKLSSATRVFYETETRDVVSWTSMIDGYVKHHMVDDALRLFDEMCKSQVEPNGVTMVAVFSACAQKGDLKFAEMVHEFAEMRGVGFSMNMMNSMLDMYAKCGSLEKAGKIFETMEVKDMFSWTSMINGYMKNGEVELARKLFDEMPERNVVSWNAMIGGYSHNNRPKDALELFHDMEREGLDPMESTLVLVLSACAQSGCMDMGQRIRDYYVKQKRTPLSVTLGNVFIDMYAKCGNIDAAREIFDEMMKKDLVSYNSMIVAYASHGNAGKALGLFEHIREVGFKPDDITFVGILSACAHGGLVKKAWDYFRAMELFGLTPGMEHYTCMIDLLGRVGHLEEAYELIRSMPTEPDEAIWGALLNGCRMHGDVELGKFAAEKLIVLDPKDSGTYMLLASLCANKRKWGDVRMARSMMRDNGVKKTAGSSSIELEGVFHDFLVADELHPESEAIYRVLGEILLLSKLDDYTTHTCQIDTFL